MQYCPTPDLSKRYKTAPFAVSEVLSIGVQLAGAVESAHRQGILHRDIKPANVLTKRSGRPALADFGIAVTTAAADDPDSVGVSIPWSPPELLADEPKGDVRSDVYSLTATLYTLLAGRSPFEIAGTVEQAGRPAQPDRAGAGRRRPVIRRRPGFAGTAAGPRVGQGPRPAVSVSAQVLAEQLQAVETELSGSVTKFDFLEENSDAARRPCRTNRAITPGSGHRHPGADRIASTTRPATGLAHPIGPADRQPAEPAMDRTQLRSKPTGGTYLDAPRLPPKRRHWRHLDPQELSDPPPAGTGVPGAALIGWCRRTADPATVAVAGGSGGAGARRRADLDRGQPAAPPRRRYRHDHRCAPHHRWPFEVVAAARRSDGHSQTPTAWSSPGATPIRSPATATTGGDPISATTSRSAG